MFQSFDASEQRLADQHRADASSSATALARSRSPHSPRVALLCLLMGLYLQFRVIRPVSALAWSAKRVAAGDLGARVLGVRSRNELGEMAVSFNEMAEALERNWRAGEEADRVKEEFFALVSHELRTPLSSIVGYVELLREDVDETGLYRRRAQRFLEIVDRNARRLQRLVGDLLFVARLEAGKLDLQRSRGRPIADGAGGDRGCPTAGRPGGSQAAGGDRRRGVDGWRPGSPRSGDGQPALQRVEVHS